jgi:branched-chain amino acid transport system permease protein
MAEQLFLLLFNGLAYGILLFLMSIGLSITMGMMNFVNLAHGAFAMLGGYLAITLCVSLGFPFLACLPIVFVAVGAVSALFEATLYRRFYRSSQLNQVLLTIGLSLMAIAGATYVWGPQLLAIRVPDYLSGQTNLLGTEVGTYRLFLVTVGAAIAGILVFGLERTRFGAMVRATVDNRRMAQSLGINVNRVFRLTFALGSGLAGLGGALAVNFLGGLLPSFALGYLLVYFLIVVTVGGLGSTLGALAAAILLGISDAAAKFYAPQIASFAIYFVMVVLLMWRPQGLLGRR